MGQQIVNEDRAHAEARPQRGRPRERERSRGQVLVVFALSSFVFVGMCAVVVDVAWYWANTLRVQRAADAAALAGAVLLPGKVNIPVSDNAYLRARNEATKNGYTSGGGVSVNPIQDSLAVTGGNPNQLDVTITAPVPTFFMRVFGINSINATRTAKGEFVLPVPMGSPQNYYGVGQFLGTTITPHVTSADTGWDYSTAAVSGGAWTNPTRANNNNDNSYATSGTTANSAQQWKTFGLLSGAGAIPNDPTLVIDGLEVRLRDQLQGSGTSTSCQLKLEVSWNASSTTPTWTTAQTTPDLSTTERLDSFGANNSLAAWVGHPGLWGRNDFSDTNFQVRLTFLKGASCGSSRQAGVDTLEVRVSYDTVTSTTYDQNASPTAIKDPVSGTDLVAQNFWGAIFTKGGVRQNGDYFAPATIGSTASGVYPPPAVTNTDPSPTYLANGYNYAVDFTGSTNGQVRLFDPIFCATGQQPSPLTGWYGAGDHWTTQGSSGNTKVTPVAITYRLFLDVNNTPYDPLDDSLVTTLAYDPAGKTLGDFSGTVGDPTSVQNYNNGDKLDCSANPAHNQWVTLASGLAGGMYRLNVETSSQAANANVGAENLFSIWVNASGGKARVYGGGRMAGYTQVGGTPQSFYLAQIEQVHAGKTLQIQLFDPGDVGGNAKLYIQSPDGNAYNNVTFDYQADTACKAGKSDSCSGAGRQYIQTAVSGSSSFDNSMITITIPLPDLYGSGGLTPPGVPGATAADKAGWWKIYYDVTNANDTTTWMVNILGNPVHLKVP